MAKKERKIIVTAAVTGAIHTPSMSPYLPCGVQGISQAAIDAANAGASMVHIHAREDNGKPTSDLDTMGQILSRIKENSDVITFHAYDTPASLERYIKQLLPYRRPMICTEFLARGKMDSTFEGSYPIFRKYNVGAVNFGLVAGKCNFHYDWNKVDADGNSIPWTEEPEIWFHDIFRPDGTPWSETEVEYIRNFIKDNK